LGFCDMAGLLAALGLAYDSDEGRRVAAGLAALMRGVAEGESAAIAARFGAREPVALLWPAPPDTTALPGLAEAASAALEAVGACHGLRHGAIITLAPADAAEALLGAETAGLFPAAGSTRAVYTATGATEIPTRAALAAVNEAWIDARLDEVPGERVGLIVGGSNFQQRELSLMRDAWRERPAYLRPSYAQTFMDSDLSAACSEVFGIRGFAHCIGGASASGQLAVVHAAQAVSSG